VLALVAFIALAPGQATGSDADTRRSCVSSVSGTLHTFKVMPVRSTDSGRTTSKSSWRRCRR
jgi:hypothetical protein